MAERCGWVAPPGEKPGFPYLSQEGCAARGGGAATAYVGDIPVAVSHRDTRIEENQQRATGVTRGPKETKGLQVLRFRNGT